MIPERHLIRHFDQTLTVNKIKQLTIRTSDAVSVWFYALLLIATGTGPSSSQKPLSCNKVHLLANTNSYEHTVTLSHLIIDRTHTAACISWRKQNVSNVFSSLNGGWMFRVGRQPCGGPRGSVFCPPRPCGFFISFPRECFSTVLRVDPACASWDTVACCLSRGAEAVMLWDSNEHVFLTWVVKPGYI